MFRHEKQLFHPVAVSAGEIQTHNAMFREAFNKVQDTGSNKSFGVTRDSRIYFDLSSPSPKETFAGKEVKAPGFEEK